MYLCHSMVREGVISAKKEENVDFEMGNLIYCSVAISETFSVVDHMR